MPAHSKFTEARRRVVVGALGCGASRRTASKLAGIDHQTLGRWIERGRTGHPEGRWRMFHDQVLEAEANPKLGLLPLPEEPRPRDVTAALAFLDRHEFAPQPAGPITVSVHHHDGEPVR